MPSRTPSHACKHVDYLRKVHRCGRSKRAQVIRNATPEQVLAICECADNFLRGNGNATTRQKERLRKHADVLYGLADPSINWRKKQEFLAQQAELQDGRGIFLPALLGALLPALVGQFTSK